MYQEQQQTKTSTNNNNNNVPGIKIFLFPLSLRAMGHMRQGQKSLEGGEVSFTRLDSFLFTPPSPSSPHSPHSP